MLPTHSPVFACLLAITALGDPAHAQSTTTSDSQFTLTEPAAVAVAESLSKAIDAVSGRVAECVAANAAAAQRCSCRYPSEVNRLRSQYQAALAKFPAWQAKVLNWSSSDQKWGRTISMPGLERQLRQECPK
jgi:histidinol-phosphate/aromatic aminotransferase/cobyric acid decarboxylase-like protein